MAKALALAAGLAVVCLTGCSPFGGGAFTCDSDQQCRASGKCQLSTGFCSVEDSSCAPGGQRYDEHSGGYTGQCVDGAKIDAGIDVPDNPQPVCFGTGLVKPCFPTAPTGTVTLINAIDTDSAVCSARATAAAGFCVIEGDTIRVEAAVGVTGSKPLVLVANTTIEIMARLDVASHRSLAAPFTTVQIGAGSAPTGGCSAGTLPGNNGGGAGGSLIGPGGGGGNATGGVPGGVQTVATLRGGCPGQDGQPGVTGKGGHGGGAVYLIANTAINIAAPLNASGEGGHPGITGSAGGGGGGSGGMIGLDAPAINNSGIVFANGASGGEGSGQTTPGEPGAEPNSVAASPLTSGGTSNGGDGGGGSGAGMANGGAGQNGGSSGGGGGGGIGIIKVYRGTLGGQFSPPPS